MKQNINFQIKCGENELISDQLNSETKKALIY